LWDFRAGVRLPGLAQVQMMGSWNLSLNEERRYGITIFNPILFLFIFAPLEDFNK
jgi:hypothetical protein